jgi:hypothetical protein
MSTTTRKWLPIYRGGKGAPMCTPSSRAGADSVTDSVACNGCNRPSGPLPRASNEKVSGSSPLSSTHCVP